jgi:hypothetical protein
VRSLGPFDRSAGGPPDRAGGWLLATEVEVYFDARNTLKPDVVSHSAAAAAASWPVTSSLRSAAMCARISSRSSLVGRPHSGW